MNNEPNPPYQAPAPVPNFNQTVVPTADDPGKTLGIIGLVFAFVGLQLIGLILSIIGHNKSRAAGFKNGLAVAGIWANSIIIGLSVLIAVPIFIIITMAASTGITLKANTSQAQTNAMTTQKYAEAYSTLSNHYPDTTAAFRTGSGSLTSLPSAISLVDRKVDVLSSDNGKTTVRYQYVGDPGASTGGRVEYWDFTTDKTVDLYTGDGTATSLYHELN